MQLKIESENFEHQEQAIVDHFAHALGKLFLTSPLQNMY